MSLVNDGPLNNAVARNELARKFSSMYEVGTEEGMHLCISVLVILVIKQHEGQLPEIKVPKGGQSYHIGEQKLMPYIEKLAAKKQIYKEATQTSRKDALQKVQEWIIEILLPRA